MDEAESFLMKSRVRSIWPHSRAGWYAGPCSGSVARSDVRSGGVGQSRFLGSRSARAIARLVLSHSNRGRTRVLGRSYQIAGNRFSCVIGFPHLRVRPPHAVGGRVNYAAWVRSRSVRVAVGIKMLLGSTAI